MADLIDREELKVKLAKEIEANAMRNMANKTDEQIEYWHGYHNGLMRAYEIVRCVPVVDAVEVDAATRSRVHRGHWAMKYEGCYMCSCCGRHQYVPTMTLRKCPACGAEMWGGFDECDRSMLTS